MLRKLLVRSEQVKALQYSPWTLLSKLTTLPCVGRSYRKPGGMYLASQIAQLRYLTEEPEFLRPPKLLSASLSREKGQRGMGRL